MKVNATKTEQVVVELSDSEVIRSALALPVDKQRIIIRTVFKQSLMNLPTEAFIRNDWWVTEEEVSAGSHSYDEEKKIRKVSQEDLDLIRICDSLGKQD